MSRELPRELGRAVFGTDPAGYARGRPGYPAELYDWLEGRGILAPAMSTLEIGAGGGQATTDLLNRGAGPLVLVEPDFALAAFLRERFGSRVDVIESTFEAADLASRAFDLVASGTAFHWVDQARGLDKAARVLRPGGRLALWWNAHHDPDAPEDALYTSLHPILEPLPKYGGGSAPGGGLVWFARKARIADLRGHHAFTDVVTETFRWVLPLDAPRMRALFQTFSPILALPPTERTRVLDALVDVLERDFDGNYDRTCATVLYVARRL